MQNAIPPGAGTRGYGADRDTRLVAELNDLLQLDRDAVATYSVAIASLSDRGLRDSLAEYRADHERHITELQKLIDLRGGMPYPLPHLPSGLLKVSLQMAGACGGDYGVLQAFRANEMQVCHKYRRHAERTHDPEVTALLNRNYLDERKHLLWAETRLEEMGAGRGTLTHNFGNAFAVVHGANADILEAAQREFLQLAGSFRRRH